MNSRFQTLSGAQDILGFSLVNLTISSVSQTVLLYVVDTLKFDIVLGLDTIPSFHLSLDDKLNISQKVGAQEKHIIFSPKSLPPDVPNVNSNELNNLRIPQELLSAKLSHLNDQQQNLLRKFLLSHISLFASDAFDVGNVCDYQTNISLSEDRFISKRPYRCSPEDQAEIERQVKELLNHGMIRQSSSPFASPVTMQYKKTGFGNEKEKTRMCIDYRDLNKIVVPESQPFPLIDEIITKARGCSWFSAVDINSAFWSIPVNPADQFKTAFVTQTAHYEWCQTPFGLKTSAASFQRILQGVLRKNNLTDFAVNYLDDVLVFSRTFVEHLEHLKLVFQAIQSAGFKLKFVKCNFALQIIQYLGHSIGPDFIQPLTDNLTAINDFPTPSSRTKIRQFLGKINFYRKFIPQSAMLLEPFHNLLRKNIPFVWSPDCQNSFDQVKHVLTSAPILAIFDPVKPISIYTDASGIGIGAVLKQLQPDGIEKPVAYFSWKLTASQSQKKAIYIESLAIREAIRYWRFWLIGRKFRVITDHKPLEKLNLKARTDEELGDLAQELLQFDFQVIYRPGSNNSEADCLSRNPVLESVPFHSEPILPYVNFLSIDAIRNSQQSVTRLPSDEIISDIVFRTIKGQKLIIVNHSFGKEIVRAIHSEYGHIGSKHVLLILRKYFYFPHMTAIVRNFCRSCKTCILNKSRRPKSAGKLGFLGPASNPYEIVSLDTIGGFGGYGSPHRYLHLLADHFSRYVFVSSSKGQSAKDMIKIVDSVQRHHQIGTLLTDQYGGLVSDEFKSYCLRNNINHIFVAVDSAFSNGLNERLNQTLVNRIRCLRNDTSSPSSSPWTTIASQCVAQYNSTPHSITTFSPAYLLNGSFSPCLPPPLIPPSDLAADRQVAFQNSINNHNYNKSRYDSHDSHVSDVSFSVGDSVYIDNGNKQNRNKLDPVRLGPCKITDKLCESVFEVDVGFGHFRKRTYHISKMIKHDL